ncbi:7-carboxy-7-deazaguanine synthase QueE [Alkanindiges sp. WGS2144]|uniref:7-carboxy-7-deazaguanine synthase QueE n=1 Tax=Alkanindiges sp. WGS2144 TaxID=3366808 RepID=UPI003752F387
MRSAQIPVTDPAAGLRLTEIFYSLQGEANASGWPSVFVRLTGCPLRCTYCDTTYSFEGGERLALPDIIEQVKSFGVAHVCVTGGEPLAQPNCIPLLTQLCDAGFKVSLETSGALSVQAVDVRVSKVMDLKTPSSGEVQRNLMDNLNYLTPHDQIKFVICDRADYDWARQQLQQYQLEKRVDTVWFSPAFAIDKTKAALPAFARSLADWIVADRLPVRFQLQLHKLLWNDEMGR